MLYAGDLSCPRPAPSPQVGRQRDERSAMSPTAVNGSSTSREHDVTGRTPVTPHGTAPGPGHPVDLQAARAALRLALPEPGSKFSQDDEWCVVAEPDGSWAEYRFHDYDRIFGVRGLYEKIFYDVLGCDSPRFMVGLLDDALASSRRPGRLAAGARPRRGQRDHGRGARRRRRRALRRGRHPPRGPRRGRARPSGPLRRVPRHRPDGAARVGARGPGRPPAEHPHGGGGPRLRRHPARPRSAPPTTSSRRTAGSS